MNTPMTTGLLWLAISTASPVGLRATLEAGYPVAHPVRAEVQPGTRLALDLDEEVFFVGGSYWIQRDGDWYSARDHGGSWRHVWPGELPAALFQACRVHLLADAATGAGPVERWA